MPGSGRAEGESGSALSAVDKSALPVSQPLSGPPQLSTHALEPSETTRQITPPSRAGGDRTSFFSSSIERDASGVQVVVGFMQLPHRLSPIVSTVYLKLNLGISGQINASYH